MTHFEADQNRDLRKAAWALIAGTTGMIVTMALHPTGSEIMHSHWVGHLNTAVHSLALLSVPVMFLGALGLTRHLEDGSRWSTAAVVLFAMSLIAGMNAATLSGFLAPWLISHMQGATPTDAALWHAFSDYNFHLNQAFALTWVVAGWAAVFAWSWAMQRQNLHRGLALYGTIMGPLVILAVVSGHLRLHVHAAAVVVLLQAVWFLLAAVGLRKAASAVVG
jgi:hypothetical protein